MNRRDFITSAAAASAAIAHPSLRGASRGGSTSGGGGRPNILVIMTDQQWAGAMSCAGNQDVRTPAMDSLAARGTRFTKAYPSQPICIPCRCSMITGRMPHQTGITHNTGRVPLQGVSFGRLLRDAGYDTAYFGKWHINRSPDDRDWHGFETIDHAKGNGIDHLIAEPSMEFIRRDRGDQPFLLFTSFVNPHDICEYARIASGIEDHYKSGELEAPPPPDACPALPANLEIPEGEPSIIRTCQAHPENAKVYPTRGWPDEKWRQYRWAYYRLTEMVDARIGRILSALRESGQEENTVVIFWSDHGDGNAAHRWNQKSLFYEETANIPLIVAQPGRTPAAVDSRHLVNASIDLLPTLCHYAGVSVPEGLPGRSFRPFAEGRDGETHRFLVSQTDLQHGFGESGNRHGRMIRTDRYKYIRFAKGEIQEQLVDLEADPGEMINLATDTGHREVLDHHRALLSSWMREHGDFFAELI